ncbi:MAG: hypothetical protein JW844_01150 [Candidatus Omnitrophica bacterium]|nr:hypothetical protein [Candidatus Omnitrophota bacterium]
MLWKKMRSFLRYTIKPYVYIPITFTKRVLLGKDPYWRQYFWSRWGYVPRTVARELQKAQPFFIAADSFGEVNELFSFCKRLKESFPETPILVSTNTENGFSLAKRIEAVDFVIDAPWDLPGPTRRVLRACSPRALIVIEQIRFPVLVREAKELNIPTLLCSGFLSEDWENVLSAFRAVTLKAYTYLDAIGAKGISEVDTFLRIGVDSKKISVTGDLKCDPGHIRISSDERDDLLKSVACHDSRPVFLAASIHKEEASAIIEGYRLAKRRVPLLRLLCVPRYPGELDFFERLLAKNGLAFVKKSLITKDTLSNDHSIILVDTMGELAKLYAVASLAFIGGSFMKIEGPGRGGHNIMEPVIQSCPFLFGPYLYHRSDILRRLASACPHIVVRTEEDLASGIQKLLEDQHHLTLLRGVMSEIVNENASTVEVNIDFVKRYTAVSGAPVTAVT